MNGFSTNIEQEARTNEDFRRVLYTGKHTQLVLMCLPAGSAIGEEVHEGNDQFFRFESGVGKVVVDGNVHEVSGGSAVIVPAGTLHNVINTSQDSALKLYTLYSPPHHKDGIVRATRDEAMANEADFDDVTTE